jgi:hypothetical protein
MKDMYYSNRSTNVVGKKRQLGFYVLMADK